MSDPAKTLADRLKSSVLNVTKDWAKQRKAEERNASARVNRAQRLYRASDHYNFKSAAYEVMEQAYIAASSGGTLPTAARQVMYQARPLIQKLMGDRQLNDQYFTQTLLPDYIEENSVDWDITYDERGHFTEPHTEHSFGLGTIRVRDYLAEVRPPRLEEYSFDAGTVDTFGPNGCYSAVLFIEKEGFLPLLEAVHLADRYDLAIMSTKGMASTAARMLIDDLCQKSVPLLALHDFDKAGFSILGTLGRDTRRFTFSNQTNVIDLGLRLTDIKHLGLEKSAEKAFDRGGNHAKRRNMRINGATDAETEFLLGRRVELNALTSSQLVSFIEGKLNKHGVKKVIPNAARLKEAYRLFVHSKRVEEVVQEAIEDIEDEHVAAPRNLSARVAAYLRKNPESRWDEAVSAIALEAP